MYGKRILTFANRPFVLYRLYGSVCVRVCVNISVDRFSYISIIAFKGTCKEIEFRLAVFVIAQ